jgi:hypothetical protein
LLELVEHPVLCRRSTKLIHVAAQELVSEVTCVMLAEAGSAVAFSVPGGDGSAVGEYVAL